MTAEAQPLRGQLNMLLLAVLQHGALHAYAVKEALRQGSSGHFNMTDGIVYPALKRLEHLGFVSSSWSVSNHRHIRVYKLTPAGRDKLSADRRAWQDFSAAVSGLLDSGPSVASPESSESSP